MPRAVTGTPLCSSSKVKRREPWTRVPPWFFIPKSDETPGTGQVMVTSGTKEVASLWVYFWMIQLLLIRLVLLQASPWQTCHSKRGITSRLFKHKGSGEDRSFGNLFLQKTFCFRNQRVWWTQCWQHRQVLSRLLCEFSRCVPCDR